MPRRPESRGICAYCGEVMTKRGVSKHMKTCTKLLESLVSAEKSDRPEENLWHLRVQDAYDKDFWLDLEMNGSASLEKMDAYLRAIWLECCGHLSQFTIGGWSGQKIGKARKADSIFDLGLVLRHQYDFGTTSETDIKVVDVREGKALSRHPIALLARNKMPEMFCSECHQPADCLCLQCLYEADEPEAATWFFCDDHIDDHVENCAHDDYGDPLPLVNSPRMGMCGYDGPAEPPY